MKQQPKSNKLADYPHVDLLFPSAYLKGAEILGHDEVVTIKAIEPRHELKKTDNSKDYKPVVLFEETDKKWVMNKTCAQVIARMYGPEILNWIGKRITLTTERGTWFGKTSDAIRVRPEVPQGSQAARDLREVFDGIEKAGSQAELEAVWAGLKEYRPSADEMARIKKAYTDRIRALKSPPPAEPEADGSQWDDVGPPPMGDEPPLPDEPPHDPRTGEVRF